MVGLRALRRWMRRPFRNKLRSELRGARVLKDQSRLEEMERLRLQTLDIASKYFDAFGGPMLTPNGPRADRKAFVQYLYVRTYYPGSASIILRANDPRFSGPVSGPVPAALAHCFREAGLRVSVRKCRAKWALYCVGTLGYGVRNAFRMLVKLRIERRDVLRGTTYLLGCQPSNFPLRVGMNDSHTLCDWVQSTPDTKVGRNVTHSVAGIEARGLPNVAHVPSPFPSMTARATAGFVAACVVLTLRAVALLSFGRWHEALFLHERIQAARARACDAADFAELYLFPISHLYFKPLWTYWAEASGARTEVYLYSVNIQGLKRPNGAAAPKDEYGYLSWNTFYVWDTYQADFIRQFLDYEAKFVVCKVLPLSDFDASVPQPAGPTIAYFDVQPFRDAFYYRLLISDEFLRPANAISALEAVLEATNASGHHVFYKRKREIGKQLHWAFANTLRGLEDDPGITFVDPQIAAQRVIAGSDAVISMPWTSTALIGREMGKPSCYLDLSGLIQAGDPAAHGIPVLRSKAALRQWVDDLPVPKA